MTRMHSLPEYLQRLWFLHETTGAPGMLNIGVDLEIRGAHEPDEIRSAFHAAVRRHDAFRLRFSLGTTRPLWRIIEETTVAWGVKEVAGGKGALESGALAREVAALHSNGFDLEGGPLVAGTLFLLDSRTSLLAITAHQLVADAYGIRILVEDFLDEWRIVRGEPVRSRKPPTNFEVWLVATAPGNRLLRPLRRANRCQEHSRTPRRGQGAECVFHLGGELASRLRAQCGRNGVTFFTGLLAGFQLACSEVCLSPTGEVGLVVSDRQLRIYGRTVGCFVRAVPFRMKVPPGMGASDFLRVTADELTRVRRTPPTDSDAAGPQSVMISMVRDTRVRLRSPKDIQVQAHRRVRVQSECDVHLFFIDRGSDFDVVLNHDVSSVSDSAVKVLRARYLEFLKYLADGRYARCNVPQFAGRLHHVGLAAWEMKLATMRLATQGFRNPGPIAIDRSIGVAMRIVGSVAGIALEVVAPLHQDAPCVGPLVREGEGVYHCCWEVGDVRSVREILERCGIVYTMIAEDSPTPLFPEGKVSFAFVPGIGLVEWLSSPRLSGAMAGDEPSVQLRIDIISSNPANGGRFLEAMGYVAQTNGRWRITGTKHEFVLGKSESSTERIVLATNSRVERTSNAPMATSWWSRVRCTSCARGSEAPTDARWPL